MTQIRRALGRLWPRRLLGQTVLLVLLALLAAQIFSALIVRGEARSFFRSAEDRFIAERLSPIAALIRESPPELQAKSAAAFSNRRLRLSVDGAPHPPQGEDSEEEHGDALAARIAAELPFHPPHPVRVWMPDDDDHHRHGMALQIAIALGPDSWLNAVIQERPQRRLIRPESWITFLVAALAISAIVFLALRRITRPLTDLTEAATRLGRGEAVPPLAERGPADVRDAIRAFNDMQTRLHRFVKERTQMLAAIGHDLRTPVTSLRLRAELLDDAEARTKMIATLDEMQRMIEAGLAFAKADSSDEATRSTDLVALTGALIDDLTELGLDIAFDAPRTPVTYPCRPVALRRALSNLIENAAKYGTRARVAISLDGGGPLLTIDDDGPGIPEADRARVFEPFVRLEESRNAASGGIGLGLAIARDIVRRHGGDISLQNRAEGGLRVTVRLPAV